MDAPSNASGNASSNAPECPLPSPSLSNDKGAASPADLGKKVFDDGLALLVGAGDDPKPARSFLAMLRKAHGDGKVADAILQAARQHISDPRPWLVATLNKAANDHSALIASAQRTFPDSEKAA